MNGGLIASVYTLAVSVIVAAVSYWFTKAKEHDADLRKLRFEFYREFVLALAQMSHDHASDEDKIRFNTATNALYLVGPTEVLSALSDFRRANVGRSDTTNDQKYIDFIVPYKRLLWAIRRDLKLPTAKEPHEFHAEYWTALPPAK